MLTATNWNFEEAIRLLITQHGKFQNCKKNNFDKKWYGRINEVTRKELNPIRLFFYKCLDIGFDFLSELVRIGELCSTFLEATYFTNLAKVVALKMEYIDRIQEKCGKVQKFEMPELSKAASDELSNLIPQFDAEGFRKALVSISRVTTSFIKFVKIVLDKYIYGKKVDDEDLRASNDELLME